MLLAVYARASANLFLLPLRACMALYVVLSVYYESIYGVRIFGGKLRGIRLGNLGRGLTSVLDCAASKASRVCCSACKVCDECQLFLSFNECISFLVCSEHIKTWDFFLQISSVERS
jgi:hypothetical protein